MADPVTASSSELALSLDDRLSLLIGRAARSHVQIDGALRQIHTTLCSPGLGVYLNAEIDSTDRLIQQCRTMVNKADLSEEVTSACQAALADAKEANQERNRVVHDMWMPGEEGTDATWSRWKRLRTGLGNSFDATPQNLDDVAAVVVHLRRSHIRLHAMYFVLWEVLPFFRGSGAEIPGQLPTMLPTMRGEFDLAEDGGWRIHGDAR
jgi:hypothetical protein